MRNGKKILASTLMQKKRERKKEKERKKERESDENGCKIDTPIDIIQNKDGCFVLFW